MTEANKSLVASQAQLVQAGKLAPLGQLGAGIAHELKQPLTGILHFAGAALDDADAGSQLAGDFTTIRDEAPRMAELIREIVGFARPGNPRPTVVQPNEALNRALSLAGGLLEKADAVVANDLPMDLPAVLADENGLQQVFLNLLTNAADALDGVPGGEIRIAELSRNDDEGSVFVTDTGADVPPGYEDRPFDPFFTTKPEGEGTGLGLSVSHGVLQSVGGRIQFKRGPDGEKRFVVTLRRARGEVDGSPLGPRERRATSTATAG